MDATDTVIATFPNHTSAEAAVKDLARAGFDMKSLSLIGRGYHTEESVVGFYKAGDRIKFWGARRLLGRLMGPFLRRLQRARRGALQHRRL